MSSPPPPPPPPPPLFCSLHRIFVCVCVRTVNEMYDVYHVCLSASPSRAGGEREEIEREVAAFFFFPFLHLDADSVQSMLG